MMLQRSNVHDYRLFGLKVRSALELPELFASEDEAIADVRIELGRVDGAELGPGLHVEGDALVLAIDGVARFRISGGTAITVEPEPEVPEGNVRLFLLGSAFGALLHQRGILPLHANAIEIDGKAVAFMGPSGAGKSTLAASFHERGLRIIADDVCAIGFEASRQPYAAPGLPRFRLWQEALELLGRDPGKYRRSYAGPAALDKFDVPVEPGSAVRSRTPLALLYVLDRGPGLSVLPLTGVDAAEAVFANTYRGGFIPAVGGLTSHWESATLLVQTTPVFRAAREWDLTQIDAQCDRLLEHARATLAHAAEGP